MYVEIIAVKAGLHDLAVFLPPQDLNIHPRRPPARQLARVAPQQMVEGISELPTVLTSFETLDEAQQLLDESGPFAQLFVWPPFYIISILGIIVGTNSA